jgi:hypothetical protein
VLTRLATVGMMSHRLEAAPEGGFQVDLRFLGRYATRAPFLRYGCRVRFDDELRTIGVERDGRLWRPTDPDWLVACRIAESSMIAAVATVDHGLYVHMMGGGTLALAMHNTLPASHPLRQVLQVFTFGTAYINELLVHFLFPKRGYFERMFGFAEGETTKLYRDAIPSFSFETLPERTERLGTARLEGRHAFTDDALLWWEAMDRFVVRLLERFSSETDPCVAAFLDRVAELLPTTTLPEASQLGRARRVLTWMLFHVTAGHRHVGATSHVLLDPTWVPAKIRPDLGGRYGEPVQESFQKQLLSIITSIHRTPRVLDDYGRRWRDQPAIAEEWSRWQADLRRVERTMEMRNLDRPQAHVTILPSNVPVSVAF